MNICGFEYEAYDYDKIMNERYLSKCRNHGEPVTQEELDNELKHFSDCRYNKSEIFYSLMLDKGWWESRDFCSWLNSLSKEDREIELNNIKLKENMYKTAIEAAPEKSLWEIAKEENEAEQKEFREKYPFLCKEYHIKGKIVSSLEEA